MAIVGFLHLQILFHCIIIDNESGDVLVQHCFDNIYGFPGICNCYVFQPFTLLLEDAPSR
jgi:hypothetical protein